jgi:hypothetical protein
VRLERVTHPQAPWWIQLWIQRWRHWKEKELGCGPWFTTLWGIGGRVGAPKWGLGRLTKKSITHTDLHKPNNKLINVQMEHLWCMDEPQANTDSQDSPWPKLGGNHHLPLYSILCAWSRDQHPNVILSQDSQVEALKFPKFVLPRLWRPITLCADLWLRHETKLYPFSRAFQWYLAHHMHARKLRRFPTFSGWESNCQFDF